MPNVLVEFGHNHHGWWASAASDPHRFPGTDRVIASKRRTPVDAVWSVLARWADNERRRSE